MVVYASSPARRLRQVLADVWTVVWCVGWGLMARWTGDVIRNLAGPARETGRAAAQAQAGLASAASSVGAVPGLGSTLRQPLDQAAGGIGSIVASAQSQVDAIERVAVVATVCVVAIPVLTWLAVWLPRRWRFVRNARAGARFVDSSEDLDLFALRAMATEPLTKIARISDDPVGAWRRGDREVIDQLAALGLGREGLPVPKHKTLKAPTQEDDL